MNYKKPIKSGTNYKAQILRLRKEREKSLLRISSSNLLWIASSKSSQDYLVTSLSRQKKKSRPPELGKRQRMNKSLKWSFHDQKLTKNSPRKRWSKQGSTAHESSNLPTEKWLSCTKVEINNLKTSSLIPKGKKSTAKKQWNHQHRHYHHNLC